MTNFQWVCHPQAEKWLLGQMDKLTSKNRSIVELKKDLLEKTSTRLFDWVDHIVVNEDKDIDLTLVDYGFELERATPHYRAYHHPGAQFPRVLVQEKGSRPEGIAVSVDSIADFLLVRGLSRPIEGTPYSGYRRSCINVEDESALWVVERRGTMVQEPTVEEPLYIQRYLACKERWMSRPRHIEDEDKGIQETLERAEAIVELVGRNVAAWIVFECERQYWQSKNTAAQLQKNRQDRLGMGWANHDHHTFRSSRRHFSQLVRLFEILGFHCRERYHAGKEAGWGAQIMENPACRLVLFLDVDLSPDEVAGDFAHSALPELNKLGTVGLWCALHGDSILQGGLHHLEAQFMFDELKEDLAHVNIKLMDPFSNFPYLRQAFTVGEQWPVDPKRVQSLLKRGLISKEYADKFTNNGAVGSHLENLQRREGYKGFNQKNVSQIIRQTDPRIIKAEG